jgi:hypothetical protein
MNINPINAINMLSKMGCSCEALNHVAQVPEPVVEALHSAWESMQKGVLEPWEIELIVSRMQKAACTHMKPQH